MHLPAELSFLAPPGDVADWRLVVLFDAVASAGALEALPGTAEEVAGRLGLSGETVKSDTRRAIGKLQADTRVHAVAIALRQAIIE